MNKKKIITIVVITIIVIALGTLAYSKSQKKPATGEPIKIGAILILSGEGSAWGEAAKNGVDLAVSEINAKGGINGQPIKVIFEDNAGSDPKTAITAFNKLTDVDGVNLIIGPNWSNSGLPLIDLAKTKQTVMISPSLGVAEFNESSDQIFNTWPHDFILSEQLADFVYEKGHRKVGLISAKNVWVEEQTAAFKNRFEELGGTIEVLVEPQPTATEVSTEALKIKNAEIDAIVSTTDGVLVGALVAKRAVELGVELPMYSITIDADAIAAAQGAYEGMEFLTFLTPTDQFTKKYEAKYNDNVEIGSDSAYDAVMMAAEAMNITGSTDSQAISDYLNGIKKYEGVSGNLISDGKGAFTKDFIAKKVVNGQAVTIEK